MQNVILDKLVQSGVIKNYSIRTLNMDGEEISNPGEGSRETEEITIIFTSGDVLVIGSFCSGSAENTSLIFR
jgi:hypothetical protein